MMEFAKIGRAAGMVFDIFTELVIRFRRRGTCCALVEYNDWHDETLASFIYLLNMLEVNVDVYVNSSALRRNAFALMHGLRYRVRDVNRPFFPRCVERFNVPGYDFVVMNSIEPEYLLPRVEQFDVPVIAVMHNALKLLENSDYRGFGRNPRHRLLVLARYITAVTSPELPLSWVAPVYLGADNDMSASVSGHITFCVQGNLFFERRNYQSLAEAVVKLKLEGISNFKVLIIGRNNTPDGIIFKNDIAINGIENNFDFSRGEIKYDNYYRKVKGCDYILPLVDRDMTTSKRYYNDTTTSSVAVAIGLGIVPVMDAELAKLYGIDDAVISYGAGGLFGAMKSAIQMTAEERSRLELQMRNLRTSLLDQSCSNLKTVLEELCIKL